VSCPGEATLAVYVDAELSPAEVRSLETHLVGCRDCRALVVALREEATLLADALHDRAREPAPVASARDAARGLALGLPLSIAAVAGALAAGGVLLEMRLPGGLSLFNPLRLKGAYEMAFDLVFMIRDSAPGLLEFAISVAVVLSVSALGSVAVGMLFRRVTQVGMLALGFAILGGAPTSRALETRFDEDTKIGAQEVIDDTLVATGDNIHVDGVVTGDLIAAAERVTVRGRVEGNLFVFGRNLELGGSVGGSIHAVVRQLRVEGEVGRSLYFAGESLTVGASGRIGRDALAFGESAVVEGRVVGDVLFAGDWIVERGNLERNLDVLHAHRLALLDGAHIAGDVDALLRDGTEIEQAPGATVVGETRTREPTHTYISHYRQPHFYAFFAIELVAGFVFGLLLYALAPSLFVSEVPTLRSFFGTLGRGLLALLATPLVLLAVAITVIGIPVAVLGLFTYVTALYLADILVGALIGRAILRPDAGIPSFARSLLLGLTLVVVAHLVPFLGPAVGLVTLLLGLGMIVERARSLPLLRRA
jgi:cytoskeletal protein CcmA (bactofilin family)